ncbi:MAG: phosphoribosyltransferase [Rhodobacteraceae bacterium]|nr:phosphoribosyltransferase [Paracoccaceae bacterium]
MRRFQDRDEAGRLLAEQVARLGLADPVVLALPRGGLPVAMPVAEKLGASLDVVFVRKIGMPGNPELAAGAVVNGAEPITVFNEGLLRMSGLTHADFEGAIETKLGEIAERRRLYLEGRPAEPLEGHDVVVVDDGIATGATVKAALKALRLRAPRSITLAVPVAPPETLGELSSLVDHTVCLERPTPFHAVGVHYHRFDQVSDQQVADQMRRLRAR